MKLSRRNFILLTLLPLLWPLGVVLHGLLAAGALAAQPVDGASPVAPTPPQAPFYQHQLIFQPVPEFIRFHAAALTECTNGDLLAACRGDRPGASRSSWDMSAAILLARKPHGSDTWSPAVAVSVTPGRMDTNPVLWTDPFMGGPAGKGGRIWLFHGTSFGVGWQYSRISVCFSDDNGQTWSPRLPINGVENLNTRCPPLSVPTATGRNIVLPVYREFGMSSCLISSDNGVTWQNSERIISGIIGNYQPSLVVRKDGSIGAFMRASGATCVLTSESLDGGWHWRPVEKLDLTNPFTSVAAAQQSPGDPVYLAFNNTLQSERRNLTLALSSNAGRSFEFRRVITPDNLSEVDAEYPAALVTADGRVHVAYTLGRTAIAEDICNREWLLAGRPISPPATLTGPGWQGLPGLGALVFLLLSSLLIAWLYNRFGTQATPAQCARCFRRKVLIGEAVMIALLFGLAPHGATFGDWTILAADDFLTVMRALNILLWVLLILIAFDLLVTLRVSTWCGWGTLVLLAGPVFFLSVIGWVLMVPPADPAFGAVERADPWAHSARSPEELNVLRRDFQNQYRAWEQAASHAGSAPASPPTPDSDAFWANRPTHIRAYADAHQITVEQAEALSPYWTGEQYLHPPQLQRIQPSIYAALAALALCWILGVAFFWRHRAACRTNPNPPPASSAPPSAAGSAI